MGKNHLSDLENKGKRKGGKDLKDGWKKRRKGRGEN